MALVGADPLEKTMTGRDAMKARYKFLYFQEYKNDVQMLGQYTPFDMKAVLSLDPDNPEHAVQRYMEFTEAARRRYWGPYDLTRLHQTGEHLNPDLTADEMVTNSITSAGHEFTGTYGTPAAELALRNQIARATPEQLVAMEATLVRQWEDVGYAGGIIAELIAKYGHEEPAKPDPEPPKKPTASEAPRPGNVYPGGQDAARYFMMNPQDVGKSFEEIWSSRNEDGTTKGPTGYPGVAGATPPGHVPTPQTTFPGHTDYAGFPGGVSREMYLRMNPQDRGKTLAEIWASRNSDGSTKTKPTGRPGVA